MIVHSKGGGTVTPEQAIGILSHETSFSKVYELRYYAGFSRDKVEAVIQEAMDMGADALRQIHGIEKAGDTDS